jgi:signal transduction histidine kinase/ActR/RegA family two-component response regulator
MRMLHQSLRSQPLSRRLAILVFGGAFSVMVAFLLWTTFHDVGTAKSVRLERTESVLSALSRDFYDLSVLRDTELNLDLVARFEAFGEVEAVCAWTTNSNDRYFLYQRTDNDLAPFRPPAIEPQMVGRALEFVHPQLIDGQVYGLTYIRVFAPEVKDRLADLARSLVILSLAIAIGAALFFRELRRKISEPVHALVSFTREVAKTRNFSRRVESRADSGELLELAGAIDFLLEQVEAHRLMFEKGEHERHQLERQLQQTQRLEAIGRLVGGVAHDFNNLLLAITGYAHLLEDEIPEGTGARDDLQEIRLAADRAAALTRQLLLFSHREETEVEIVNLNELVNGLENMLRRLIGEDVAYQTIADENIGAIQADPGQLEQLLVNLVINARDAMPSGGTLVVETAKVNLDAEFCRVHAEMEPGAYVQLTVTDSGEGMTDEVQERLFEPFFTTKKQGKGTGLGLATCHGIVKSSGGCIMVSSKLGNGTVFKIFLPVTSQDKVLTAKDQQTPLTSKAMSTETLLLVEDEAAVRHVAARTLRRRGYVVLEAADGLEALEFFDGGEMTIDLVVSDVIMPRMGGVDLLEELKSRSVLKKMLFTSGYTDDAFRGRKELRSQYPFLQKPYSPEALARMVRQILDDSTEKGPG